MVALAVAVQNGLADTRNVEKTITLLLSGIIGTNAQGSNHNG